MQFCGFTEINLFIHLSTDGSQMNHLWMWMGHSTQSIQLGLICIQSDLICRDPYHLLHNTIKQISKLLYFKDVSHSSLYTYCMLVSKHCQYGF